MQEVGRAVLCAPITVDKAAGNSESSAPTGVVSLPGCDLLCRQTGDQFTQEALDFLGVV